MEMAMSDRWRVPAVGLLLGASLFAAASIGGQVLVGVGMFAVVAIYSLALVALGGRSEMVGVLRGQPVDERLAGFDLVATAVAGLAATLAALGGFAWQIATGGSGTEFAMIAAVAGISYLGALAWLRWRH